MSSVKYDGEFASYVTFLNASRPDGHRSGENYEPRKIGILTDKENTQKCLALFPQIYEIHDKAKTVRLERPKRNVKIQFSLFRKGINPFYEDEANKSLFKITVRANWKGGENRLREIIEAKYKNLLDEKVYNEGRNGINKESFPQELWETFVAFYVTGHLDDSFYDNSKDGSIMKPRLINGIITTIHITQPLAFYIQIWVQRDKLIDLVDGFKEGDNITYYDREKRFVLRSKSEGGSVKETTVLEGFNSRLNDILYRFPRCGGVAGSDQEEFDIQNEDIDVDVKIEEKIHNGGRNAGRHRS